MEITFSNTKHNIDLNSHENSLAKFNSTIEDPQNGFFRIVENKDQIQSCKEVLDQFQNKKRFVHIGIGGSSLGPKMLIQALTTAKTQRSFDFWENIDPTIMGEALEEISIEDTLFFVVSKSGGTAETLASLAVLLQHLEESGITADHIKDHLVCATGPSGVLRDFSNKHSLQTLLVPEDIGGRFCVLSPVGLLPAMFAGIDVHALLDGAHSFAPSLLTKNAHENGLFQTAEFLIQALKKQNISNTVFMPYSGKLKEFAAWFVQLWAESLGKKYDLEQNTVHTGLTPIAAIGATDQHSQVQLFMEGPRDKSIVFIEIQNHDFDQKLKNSIGGSKCDLLSSFSMSDLLKAELEGTKRAAHEHDIPFLNLKIERLDAHNLGKLILFFECLTVLIGQKLNINPFDQPGVEAGKIYAFEWLNDQIK
jgi:glucose-6-phosphate isomerase